MLGFRTMNRGLFNLLLRWIVLAVGVMLAARIIPGIKYDTAGTLIVVVLVMSFFNAVLRPLLILFTMPLIIFSLGLGVLAVNALLFYFVGEIIQGFEVASFWSALGGSVIVSVTSMVMNRVVRGVKLQAADEPKKRPPSGKGDVIDI